MHLYPRRTAVPLPQVRIAMSSDWDTDRASERHMNPLGRLHCFRVVSLKVAEKPLRSRPQTVGNLKIDP